MWGWIIGSLEGRVSHTSRNIAAVMAATLTVSLIVAWMSGLYGLAAFFVSAVCALCIHVGWRRSLRHRLGSDNPDHQDV